MRPVVLPRSANTSAIKPFYLCFLRRILCRHYYFIDAEAAADYVLTYRDMWDSEESGEEI